jgi:hypothetical protein
MSNVQAQNARFKQALANKEITQAQYNQAMAYQNAQSQPSFSPMPSDPSSTVVRQSGDSVWVSSKYNVSKVEESNTGTTYTLTPRAPAPQTQGPPSLSERMLDVQTPPVLPSLGIGNPQAIFKSPLGSKPAPVRPLAPIAGIVASGESLVYFVPNILGVKGVPQAPPTLTSGLIGKGVQGAAGLVGYNATSNELETVMLNQRYGGAYAVGSVFGDVLTGVAIGKAVGYGVKTYKVLTPKINAVADKTASTIGWKIYDKGYRVIEPVYQKFNRVSSVIDSTDIRLSSAYKNNVVMPLKLNIAEPIATKIITPVSKVATRAKTVAKFEAKMMTRDIKESNPFKSTDYSNFRLLTSPLDVASQKVSSEINQFKIPLSAIRNFKNYSIPLNAKNTLPKDYEVAANVLKRIQSGKPMQTVSLVKKGKNFSLIGDQILENKPAKLTLKNVRQSSPKNYRLIGEQMVEMKEPTLPKVKGAKSFGVTSTKNLDLTKDPTETLNAINNFMGKSKPKFRLKEEIGISDATPLMQTSQSPKASLIQMDKAVAKIKEPTLPKVARGTGISAGGYPGTTKQTFREEEETQFLTMPNQKLTLDKPQMIFHNPLLGTQQNQRVPQQQKSFPQLSFLRQPISTKPNTSSMLTPMTSPMFNQRIDTKPMQISQFKTAQMPKLAQTQMPKMKVPMMPSLSLGGGFDNLGPKGNRTGQWFQKKHKIKTYTQMLNTFGVGKAAKPMRQVDKALSKHINKLDKKLIRKSVRRTKR